MGNLEWTLIEIEMRTRLQPLMRRVIYQELNSRVHRPLHILFRGGLLEAQHDAIAAVRPMWSVFGKPTETDISR